MDKNLRLGLWRVTLAIPPRIWKRAADVKGDPLEFMTEAHRRVRDFAVTELTRSGNPLSPDRIAQELQLRQARVEEVLHDLERHKTFVVRNAQGAVSWAFPVTVDPTPHRVRFSTGELVYAA